MLLCTHECKLVARSALQSPVKWQLIGMS